MRLVSRDPRYEVRGERGGFAVDEAPDGATDGTAAAASVLLGASRLYFQLSPVQVRVSHRESFRGGNEQEPFCRRRLTRPRSGDASAGARLVSARAGRRDAPLQDGLRHRQKAPPHSVPRARSSLRRLSPAASCARYRSLRPRIIQPMVRPKKPANLTESVTRDRCPAPIGSAQ